MQKQIKLLLSVVLAFAIILSVVSGVAATEHEHKWEIQSMAYKTHSLKCSICGETRIETHIVNSAEICTVCGCSYHPHNWQRTMANTMFHTMVCSSCGESQTITHTFDSANRCTVCDYQMHECVWQYSGVKYDDEHGLRCTNCDSTSIEDHIYGSDGNCTVCGAPPPHTHQWSWNGQYDADRYHVLSCACGETKNEEHKMAWDGKTRDDKWHKMACIVCGYSATYGHWYSAIYVGGTRCLDCGYETVPHVWKYNNFSSENGHQLICSHCNILMFTGHKVNSSGKCTVCGYHANDTTQPGTTPTEITPTEITPTEAKAERTDPTETKAEETNPAETKPAGTNATEAKPAETEPAASETIPENAANGDLQPSSTMWIWVTVAIVVAGGLGVAVFILKKKLS